MPPRAAYLHVPFCTHRCGYCNFTVVAGRDDLVEPYLDAIERELSWLQEPREVDTLFLGGGTPTRLLPAQLDRLLSIARRWFPPAAGCEISVEANPADMDRERVDVLAAHGATRVSLGAQSFRAEKLRLLERDHDAGQIAHACKLVRGRIAALSLDLIFAAPGETLEDWLADLDAALDLGPQHVSTYGLTFERGTTFWGRQLRDDLAPLDDETQRAMFAAAIDRLSAAGFEHYEVSNFARAGFRCRHNQVYWAGEEYYAAGPGAARYVGGRREVNHRSTTTWLRRVQAGQSPVAEREELSAEDRTREMLVLGLRRMEGVDRAEFHARTGYDLEALGGAALRRFLDLGLLADSAGRVHLTREGLFVSDSLWPHFLRA